HTCTSRSSRTAPARSSQCRRCVTWASRSNSTRTRIAPTLLHGVGSFSSYSDRNGGCYRARRRGGATPPLELLHRHAAEEHEAHGAAAAKVDHHGGVAARTVDALDGAQAVLIVVDAIAHGQLQGLAAAVCDLLLGLRGRALAGRLARPEAGGVAAGRATRAAAGGAEASSRAACTAGPPALDTAT